MATLKTLLGSFAALTLIAGSLTAITYAPTAQAQASNSKAVVDAAIARGEVGEQISGYLAVVDGVSVSADVSASVEEINIKRKAVYTKLSTAQNVQPAIVAKLTGEKQLAKAAPGTYIKGASGTWTKK